MDDLEALAGRVRAARKRKRWGQQELAEQAGEERRDWPRDVAVFLDVMGLFLKAVPEDARADIIHDLTRQVMNHPSR